MTAETASLIAVSNLSRSYGDHRAVDDISFRLERGQVLGFLGPNGAGKSTTMQMLTGNLAPHHGSIFIDGQDLLDQPIAAKSRLGYLPEQPPLYRELNVLEYLDYCARLHRLSRSQISRAIDYVVERCALGEVRQRLIGNLSKGFQQRVGIAQAILHRPAVIILDEPTVGLDPIQIIDIRSLIRELGEEHGVILCTHILPEVQAVCNRVQIINRGRLVYSADMAGIDSDDIARYDIELDKAYASEQLAALNIASEIIEAGEGRYTIASDMEAAIITGTLCREGLGLRHFSRHRDSLEAMFIDIISDDGSAAPDSAGKDRP